MFGLSFSHMILLGIILLIVVGPEQLPEVARNIARVLNELRRATGDFQNHFTSQLNLRMPNPMEPPSPPVTPSAELHETAGHVTEPPPASEEKKPHDA